MEGARPSGVAGNANRNGYSRRVVLRSSVNVIANPVRVAPIPKVIAHVPTNIFHNDIWSWAFIDQGRDAQRGDVSCDKRKGETNGNAHRWVAANLQQQRRFDQCRPLVGTHGPDLRYVVCLLTTAAEALTPAVAVLIVRLQDADKIGHAGSIPVFDLNRNRSIGCRLAPLPNPE
jgi:hypothetical protein